MVRLDENLEKIRKAQDELNRCRTKGPHYRDTQRRLRKLRQERAEAIQNLRKAGKI